jgi:hypothetical protein
VARSGCSHRTAPLCIRAFSRRLRVAARTGAIAAN